MPRSRGGRLAIKGTVDVVVDRPIQEVWEFVSDFKNMEGWVDGVSDLKPPEGELGIGSTFASKYTYGNRTHDITYEVTAFDPPLHIAMKSTSGPFPFEGTLTLEKWGDGTKVTNTIEAGSDSLFTTVTFVVLRPLIGMMMRKQLRKELRQLKAIVEG